MSSVETEPEVLQATWKIAWDGYFPFCSNCRYEPADHELIGHHGELPEICPRCKAIMTNYQDFINFPQK